MIKLNSTNKNHQQSWLDQQYNNRKITTR